ncbi:MAG: hypothetical protein NTX88_01985 [Candidatus Atribacteria bacterium]|nr:hypothetical protein [Candidatus Atribacteria bacterium]
MGRTLKLVTVLTWKEYLSEFLTEKRIQGCRETTIKDYVKFLNYFFRSYSGDIDDYPHLHNTIHERANQWVQVLKYQFLQYPTMSITP